jgi:hypothetical protein
MSEFCWLPNILKFHSSLNNMYILLLIYGINLLFGYSQISLPSLSVALDVMFCMLNVVWSNICVPQFLFTINSISYFSELSIKYVMNTHINFINSY